jgi:aryl sulfotransferase
MILSLVKAPTRVVRSRVFDSTRWRHYKPRADDIIIATYSKCGTTWMQRIVGMLVFRSAAPFSIPDASPWFDMRAFGPIEERIVAAENQEHRRFLKTHLPLDALPIYEGVKFIHVVRDGRDAAMSLHNHLSNFSSGMRQRLSEISRADPKFGDDYPPVPENPADFFAAWIRGGDGQGDEGASYFHIEPSFWEAREEQTMLLVHYNDLKSDLNGEMRRIAAYLDIEIPEAVWPELVEAATFESMKAQGAVLLPHAQQIWDGGASRFLNKGDNGRWRQVLHPDDLERYDRMMDERFPADLRQWIAQGRAAL